ncbi:exosortase B [Sphaerotilus hippei]|uniref:Exosortase B n=1 Tax=Sphaerotilus hippei TaxID=744406 RepID=A0A318GYB4_9BURK|nr:exosortase B [Sphaerotilus hippei]PXW94954.1 exosortase B [Sphaerotilus hippei]
MQILQSYVSAVFGKREASDTAHLTFLVVAAGFLAMFVPVYLDLARHIWSTDEQGHGPIILGLCAWLIWRSREALIALPARPARRTAAVLMALCWPVYAISLSQGITTVEGLLQPLVVIALLLWFKGWPGVRLMWFPLAFMLFMVPVPSTVVLQATMPLKVAVSSVAEPLLHALGYPIARTGVILQVGQYQLLVADACAGLNSIFTLEALGLLYLNMKGHASAARNLVMACLIFPASFLSNVIRVCTLVLVTYHFGDAAGQGFTHTFAGMVLFLCALVIIIALDHVLDLVWKVLPARTTGAPR